MVSSGMIYVILPVHNRLEQTKKVIDCLKKQTQRNIHLILVDCGSTDGTSEWVEKNFTNTDILRRKKNVYWGDALREAKNYLAFTGKHYQDKVLILNNDGVFNKYFVEIGSKLCHFKKMVTAEAYANGTQFDGLVHVDWKRFKFTLSKESNICSTRGLFLDAKDFIENAEIPKYLPHYTSDYAMTYLLWLDGWKIGSDSRLKIETDMTCTGIVNPKGVFQLFSILCPDNPIYKTIFILKCCPKKYWFINILKSWGMIVKIILKHRSKHG